MSELTPRLNLSKPADGNTEWGAEIRGNFDTLDSVIGNRHLAERKSGHVGLAFAYHPGNLIVDNKFAEITAGIVTLTNNATNYVEAYIDGSTGRVISNVNEFTKNRVPLFVVTTSSGSIAQVKDLRTWNKTVTVDAVERQLNFFQEQLSEREVAHSKDDLNNLCFFGYYGGTIAIGNRVATIAEGRVALVVDQNRTSNVLNYIQAGFDASGNPVVVANSTGFTEGYIPLFKANVSPTLTIDNVQDVRAWLSSYVKPIRRFIELEDTPASYSNNKILKSTSSGLQFVDESDNANRLHNKELPTPTEQDDKKFIAYDFVNDKWIFMAGTDIANELDNRLTEAEGDIRDIQTALPEILALEQNVLNNTNALKTKSSNVRAMGFYVHGALEVEQRALTFICPIKLTITEIVLAVDERPIGADIVVDINKNGTTLYTNQANRPRIVDGQTSSSPVLPSIVAINAGDRISIDIDSVGFQEPGTNLILTIKCVE